MEWEQRRAALKLVSIAFALEHIARLREEAHQLQIALQQQKNQQIQPDPELERIAEEACKLLAEGEVVFANIWVVNLEQRVREMVAHLPPWLVLSADEMKLLEESAVGVLDEFPDATWSDLLWCFAVGAVRPRARGRKAKWAGAEGMLFVTEVEFTLKAKGWKRDGEKGLRRAIAILRESSPQRYAKFTENALRAGYYAALPHYAAAQAAIADFHQQSGKSNEYPDPIFLETL